MNPYFQARRPPPTQPATEYDFASNMRPMQVPLPNAQTGGVMPPQMLHPQMSGGFAPRPSFVPQMAGGLPPMHMGRLWQLANGERMRPRQIRQGLFGLVP